MEITKNSGIVLLFLWVISITYGREFVNIAVRSGLCVSGTMLTLGFLFSKPKKRKITEPNNPT